MILLLLLLNLVTSALCSNITLPSYPLAVKNPYLQAWFPGKHGASFPSSCPMFWTGKSLIWLVLAKVDKTTYSLFGCPQHGHVKEAKQIARDITSSHTLVTLKAGPVVFELDFFSPVSLVDYVRQSIPFSYLSISIKNDPPKDAQVSIMSSIDDSWTAQVDTQAELSTTGSSVMYSLSGVHSIPRTENNNMASYGRVVFAANKNDAAVTHQAGGDTVKQFQDHGKLSSQNGYQHGDLVALAYELDKPAQNASVTFAVGLEREDAILWLEEIQTGYYRSKLADMESTVDYFFSDKHAAEIEAVELDEKVLKLGSYISPKYAEILQASIRQIWGGFDVVIPTNTKNTSQAKAFMKEISTDGNVNTLADLVPKSIPAFYALAPTYIRLLLEPIMTYTRQWPADFAFHDLGKHYPNATGETIQGEEKLVLDQTSVIHWMAYSYQKASGDKEWVKPYVSELQKYADYLVQHGLYSASERMSADHIRPTANQTILAMYSAIGLTSFGTMTGKQNYTEKGKEFAEELIKLGLDSTGTHLKIHYNDTDSSWITAYPFGFDKMLDLNTFNSSMYSLQSKWYEKHIHPFGIQFLSDEDYEISDFGMWAAAVSSADVRNVYVDSIYKAWTDPINNAAVGPTQWNVFGKNVGKCVGARAKSTVGSYFMPAVVAQMQDT